MLLRAGFLTIALAVNNLSLNTGSVFAADAGDSCCRDLEYRIAELEAMAARAIARCP
jgi:hypothetical protein